MAWKEAKFKNLDDKIWQRILFETGAIPLFLNQFRYDDKKQTQGKEDNRAGDDFDEEEQLFQQFYQSEIIKSIGLHLNMFTKNVLSILTNTQYHLPALQRFISEGDVSFDSPSMYDQRYCFKKNGIGKVSCGIARRVLVKILRQNQICLQKTHQLVQICKTTKNPSMKGFAAEEIIIDHLFDGGAVLNLCNNESLELRPDSWWTFDKGCEANQLKEVVGTLMKNNKACAILQPYVWNYTAIDAMLVHLDSTMDSPLLTLVPIQITLSSIDDHKSSIETFFRTAKKTWLSDTTQNYNVRWVFMWIVRGSDLKTAQQNTIDVRKSTRSGSGETIEFIVCTKLFSNVLKELEFLDNQV